VFLSQTTTVFFPLVGFILLAAISRPVNSFFVVASAGRTHLGRRIFPKDRALPNPASENTGVNFFFEPLKQYCLFFYRKQRNGKKKKKKKKTWGGFLYLNLALIYIFSIKAGIFLKNGYQR